jgi:hypothetical protein
MRSGLLTLWLALLFASGLAPAARAANQSPGPASDLFANHYYHCNTSYYVSSGGADNNPGTQANPWKTLQGANNNLSAKAATAPGTCVFVAPGTYDGVQLNVGGNFASADGYLAYRCTTLDRCIVKGDVGYHGAEAFETVWPSVGGVPPNYLMIDGFVMKGGNANGSADGVTITNGDNGPEIASHHIWILNSVITGFGQSGVAVAATEYIYLIHNRVYGNSNLNCGAQGSGIAFNILHAIPNYTPTADDRKNPNPLLGPTWVTGNAFFHVVAEWNAIYNNALTQCATESNPGDTDGNGLIFDTNLQTGANQGDSENYLAPSLVAFNLTYNNGGGGLHFYLTANATVANNTCFNNYLDPGNSGSGRPCIDNQSGYGFTFINNIAVAIPTAHSGTCFPVTPPYTGYNFAMLGGPSQAGDLFSNNITRVIGPTCNGSENSVYNGDVFTCAPGPSPSNQCATDPAWVAADNITTGTETTPPQDANFALQPGSPAIGTGLTKPYLPPNSVDVGACNHNYKVCR